MPFSCFNVKNYYYISVSKSIPEGVEILEALPARVVVSGFFSVELPPTCSYGILELG